MNVGTTNPGAFDPRERALELLADRALVGLDGAEEVELDRLLLDEPELDDDSMDMAAAALCVAGLGVVAPAMPAALRERVLVSSGRWLGAARRRAGPRPALASGGRRTPDGRDPRSRAAASGRRAGRRLGGLGWLAAAAAIMVAALAWWPSLVVRRSAEQRRAELLGSSTRTIEWPWTRIEHPLCAQRIGGDVVWSGERQEGFLTISGLAPNDPTALQYQLWIFDATRDERYPVDGGVFDIPPDRGEAIIPIRAAVDVREPVMFAVTVEPPGGVVVSKRELVAVAKP